MTALARARLLWPALFLACWWGLLWSAAPALAADGAAVWGMQEPASEVATRQRELHEFVMWIIVGIGVVVFGAMFYSIFYHRKKAGREAAQFHENTAVEVLWTMIPLVIVIVLAARATALVIDYKDTSAPDLTIKVTGYQWHWGYDYLDSGVALSSRLLTPPESIGGKFYGGDGASGEKGENYLLEVDNPLVVPVGQKVRLLLTAADVIHAWWVPQLGVKQDAIPGLVREAWFRADRPGVYRGQCAELCGKNHAFMPIVVRAVDTAEFDDWLVERGARPPVENPPLLAQAAAAPVAAGEETAAAAKEWTESELMTLGEGAYATHCAACHQASGEGLAPAFPALKGAALTAAGQAAAHIQIVLQGKPGTAMAAFHYLSDEDLAAIVTYERLSWGNDGGAVFPADISAAR